MLFDGQVAQNVSSVAMVRWSKRWAWLIARCAKVQVLLSNVRYFRRSWKKWDFWKYIINYSPHLSSLPIWISWVCYSEHFDVIFVIAFLTMIILGHKTIQGFWWMIFLLIFIWPSALNDQPLHLDAMKIMQIDVNCCLKLKILMPLNYIIF